jgi:hypothetical protein
MPAGTDLRPQPRSLPTLQRSAGDIDIPQLVWDRRDVDIKEIVLHLNEERS